MDDLCKTLEEEPSLEVERRVLMEDPAKVGIQSFMQMYFIRIFVFSKTILQGHSCPGIRVEIRPVENPNPVAGIRDLTNPESRGILGTGLWDFRDSGGSLVLPLLL